MHASIEHNFKGKQPKTKAKFTWMDEYFESAPNAGKKANTSYNLGASLLAKHKNIDLSTSYNMRLKKKFIAHQGSLQLKVNF